MMRAAAFKRIAPFGGANASQGENEVRRRRGVRYAPARRGRQTKSLASASLSARSSQSSTAMPTLIPVQTLEILALRHQLKVLERSRPRRLRLAKADRRLWAWLSVAWSRWRAALVIVKPETVIAWHRQGVR